jgi:hypothetical protein
VNDLASRWEAHMHIPQIYNIVHTKLIKTCTEYTKIEIKEK